MGKIISFFKQEAKSVVFSAILAFLGIKPEQTISKILSKVFGSEFLMLNSLLFQFLMIASAIGIIYHSLRRYIKQTLEEQKTAKKEDFAQMQTVEKSREKEDSSSIWENYGKRLVSQLSDSDVEAMAGGTF